MAASSTTAVVVTTSSWTDLGTGAMQVQAPPQSVFYAIADAAPSSTSIGFTTMGTAPLALQPPANAHVWARANSPVSSQFVSVMVAPLSSASGSPQNPQVVTPSAVWPVFDSRERLARANGYFVFATGSAGDFTKGGLSVAAGSYLNVRVCNVGSKTAYITKRIFDMSATAPIAYGGISAPAVLAGQQVSGTSSTSTNGANVTAGGSVSSTLQMTYSVGTGHVDNAAGNAAATGTGYLYPNNKNELTELRIIPPGQCFGQYINVPSGLGGSAFVSYRLYEYEE